MTFGNATLRGGQTLLHDARMWGQLFRWGILGLVLAIVLTPAIGLFTTTSAHEWRVIGLGTLAEFKLGLKYDPDSRQTYEWRAGERTLERISLIASDPRIERIRRRMLDTVHKKAWVGLWIGLGGVALFVLIFWFLGRRMARAYRVRGAEMTSAQALARRVTPLFFRLAGRFFPAARKSKPRIAGVPWPERAETQHTIVSGTTGSGKTVLISDLVSQIRERGERCILYDKMGSYTRAFLDPTRDVLMNPLDARAPRWSPFLEARTPRDFDTMAAALIPQQKDTVDPFWVTAARQLFANGAGVLWKRGVTKNSVLVEHLLKTELTSLAEAMEGTVAQSIVDPENPKTALSVRAMLTAYLGALECLPDTGVPFSIREWVEREDETGFLFLTSRGDQHASLRGLISTWLEIAVNALLSLGRDDARRVWIVLDELPTLHQVPSLQPGLAESRQFGGCFVLGVQVISALRDLYGRNGAETVSGLCGTRVVLAAPDQETARWSAESLGRGEVTEYAEGLSYGASAMRDGVSLTQRREMRPLALPSEIMRLENLNGYLKFPGPWPVARIRLDYVERPKAAESFVPRENAPLTEEAEDAEFGPQEPLVDTPGDEARASGKHVPGESDVAVPREPQPENLRSY
ncbi:MAG: type IV secretion system DNA-binding domain-containing protein [Nitrospinae bacterium]|nr:type IV secretion system DNA-binding domain-containing protein [Nitrospinota bacterium]